MTDKATGNIIRTQNCSLDDRSDQDTEADNEAERKRDQREDKCLFSARRATSIGMGDPVGSIDVANRKLVTAERATFEGSRVPCRARRLRAAHRGLAFALLALARLAPSTSLASSGTTLRSSSGGAGGTQISLSPTLKGPSVGITSGA